MSETRINSASWYDHDSAHYIANTESVDLSELYDRFLARLPARARILDAGCGSGRDGLAFKRRGHAVVAADASIAMVQHASKALAQEAVHLRHEDLAFVDAFNGIWSNASLLHVPRAGLPDVFGRLRGALVPAGILFCSFKLGEDDVYRSERLFTNQTADSLRQLIDATAGLELMETWTSRDLRPGRQDEQWLNAMCRRTG